MVDHQAPLLQVPGVQSVFDLHVWALKPSIPLLAAHVTVQSGVDCAPVGESQNLLTIFNMSIMQVQKY